MNFSPYFLHILSVSVKFGIRDLHIILLSICKLFDNSDGKVILLFWA